LRRRDIGVKKVMDSLKNYKKDITTKKGRKVVLRAPREDDVLELMKYINALVKEDTFISQNKKVTRKEEERYLVKRLRAIKEKKGFNILAEYKGEIIANGGVDRKVMRREHVGELGISVAKGFRNEGLGTIETSKGVS
jgi:RimJ/RimL family protein N-acetyltransferase